MTLGVRMNRKGEMGMERALENTSVILQIRLLFINSS